MKTSITMLVLFLLNCNLAFSEIIPGYNSTAFEQNIKEWTAQLVDDYKTDEWLGRPEDLEDGNMLDRARNEVFFWMLRSRIKEGLGKLGVPFAEAPNKLMNRWKNVPNSKRTEEFQKVLEEFENSPARALFHGSFYKRFRKLLSQSGDGNGSAFISRIVKIASYFDLFENDMKEYSKLYGEEFFTKETLARGAVNTLTMYAFAEADDKKIASKSAVYALALLHPITDVAIDSGNFRAETLSRMTQVIKGENILPSYPYERVVFSLIKDIQRSFPVSQHGLLHQTLLALHLEQITSLKQKGKLSKDDLLTVSFRKGGFSTVLAGYIALNGVTDGQLQYFFQGGGIFQLMDDYLDIEADVEDGIWTCFSSAVRDNWSMLEEPMKRFMHIQSEFECNIDNYVRDFSRPETFKMAYLKGYKIVLLKGTLKNSPEIVGEVENLIAGAYPLRINSFRRIQDVFKLLMLSLQDSSHSRLASMGRMLEYFDAY